MKKSVQSYFVLIVGLFVLLSLFAIISSVYFVSAETVADDLTNKISNGFFDLSFLTTFGEGTGFAKFLFFLLVALIVFGITEVIPFLGRGTNKTWISMGVAIIVAILSTLYLDNTQVYSILLSYNALGVTLTAIIPFIIIFFASIKVQEQGYGFFAKVIWLVFGIVLLGRWLFADTAQIGNFGRYVYPIVFLAVLIMFIFERPIVKLFIKSRVAGLSDRLGKQVKEQSAKRKIEAHDFEDRGLTGEI
ncbi:MAG: hypothetical protein AABX03_01760 [Nanoarchaeota archaeon]